MLTIHVRTQNYQIERCSTSKNEINSAFNIAIFEEMVASVITECILKSNQSAIVECRFGPGNSQRNRLLSRILSIWSG